jgi:5'-phosphate synthase pdxT subunit
MPSVGVLALQGGWQAHLGKVQSLGADARPVRTAAELAAVDGLILPGGESTAMLKLMQPEGLGEAIREHVQRGRPVLATCAGVILLAAAVSPAQRSLGLLDLEVERNAYGRQLDSTIAAVDVAPEVGPPSTFEGVFIRAPKILRSGRNVEVLGRWGDDAVLVRQGAILGATFHPELTDDQRIHGLFLRAGERAHDQAIAAAR